MQLDELGRLCCLHAGQIFMLRLMPARFFSLTPSQKRLRMQVHPISLRRFGKVMQKVDSRKAAEWVYRPLIAVGPPDAEQNCQVLALPGLKKPQKHPVDRTIMYCSHNGILNVYGSERGLLALAAELSQVHSAKFFCDSAVLTMHKHDIDLFLESLSSTYADAHQARFSKEGTLALLQNP
jgi:hypothetical protein